MSQVRRCSRPGCTEVASATLRYSNAERTAFIGPLSTSSQDRGYDICAHHAARLTVPTGWELVRVEDIHIDRRGSVFDEEDDLTALAKAMAKQVEQPSRMPAAVPRAETGGGASRRKEDIGLRGRHPSQADFRPYSARHQPIFEVVPKPESYPDS
ncbi:MAG: DUF3499 family protein [Corynebacterium sp.]|nr:DUF3499 family protein [Corynebacterium sp.]